MECYERGVPGKKGEGNKKQQIKRRKRERLYDGKKA